MIEIETIKAVIMMEIDDHKVIIERIFANKVKLLKLEKLEANNDIILMRNHLERENATLYRMMLKTHSELEKTLLNSVL